MANTHSDKLLQAPGPANWAHDRRKWQVVTCAFAPGGRPRVRRRDAVRGGVRRLACSRCRRARDTAVGGRRRGLRDDRVAAGRGAGEAEGRRGAHRRPEAVPARLPPAVRARPRRRPVEGGEADLVPDQRSGPAQRAHGVGAGRGARAPSRGEAADRLSRRPQVRVLGRRAGSSAPARSPSASPARRPPSASSTSPTSSTRRSTRTGRSSAPTRSRRARTRS